MPSLQPHRNILTGLIVELEREAREAQRRGDDAAVRATHLTEGGTLAVGTISELARERGIQDATASIVGRLRNIAGAPIGRLIDLDALREDFHAAAWEGTSVPKAFTAGSAADIAIKTLEARTIGGN